MSKWVMSAAPCVGVPKAEISNSSIGSFVVSWEGTGLPKEDPSTWSLTLCSVLCGQRANAGSEINLHLKI